MKRTNALLLALLLAGVTPAWAQQGNELTTNPDLPTTRVGTRGATFLHLGVGARAQALAGAFTGAADDVTALYWNTAGIARLDGFAAGLTQANLYEDADIKHTFVGVVLPLGAGRLGISLNTVTSGDMPFTTEEFPNAGFGGDVAQTRTEFSYDAMAAGLHYGRAVTDRLVVGFAGKYITEGIPGTKATFFAADMGAIFHTGIYGITLGAALNNLGSSARMEGDALSARVNTGNSETQVGQFVRIIEGRFQAAEAELPTTFRFSVMTDLLGGADAILAPSPNQSLRLMWDLNDAIDTDLQSSLGVEYGFRDMAFLRAGKRWSNEAQISRDFSHNASFGAGVKLPIGSLGKVGFDYAYTGLEDLDNIQVFTFQLQF
jgi:hypothetical protein